ncbi:hypothetical protein [Actinomyces sp. MRS3W]|uniref:hypothetical protein n=1 Tax=Actinomyces sp. MRS3W TaxID=2800796 RepID=UPI0028FDAFF7|nr:hypothetical protein [Actinomyces sp. MRS3W]MDU0348784.1 hypothetical protein [Actinomyces sp. MRS3W]
MSRLSRPLILAATGLATVALALPLAACSGSNTSETTSTQASQEATANSEDAADTGSDTDAQTDSDSTASVPDGFTLVEIPEYDMSVAVPSDWDTLTSANSSDTELVGRIAQALDKSEDEVIADLEDTALISADTSSSSGDASADEIAVGRAETDALPTEEEFIDLAELNEADSSDYTSTTTPSGLEAAVFRMNAVADDEDHYISIISVSTGDGIVDSVLIATSTAERDQEIYDAVLGSL